MSMLRPRVNHRGVVKRILKIQTSLTAHCREKNSTKRTLSHSTQVRHRYPTVPKEAQSRGRLRKRILRQNSLEKNSEICDRGHTWDMVIRYFPHARKFFSTPCKPPGCPVVHICSSVEYMSDPPRGLLLTLAFSGSRSHTSPPWCEWLPVRLWGGSNH